jgi:hypothetical protein
VDTYDFLNNTDCAFKLDWLRFTTPIPIEYFFEDKQELEFLVYDIDDPRATLDKQDFLGSFKVIILIYLSEYVSSQQTEIKLFLNLSLQTTLGSIVGARGSCLTSALSGSKGANEKRYGSIKILAEEIPSNSVC